MFEHLGGAQFERQAWARGLTPGRRVIVRTRGGQHLMSSHVIRVREFAPYDVRITVESADGTRGEFSAFDQRCTANSLGHFARTQIVPSPPELDQTAEEYRLRFDLLRGPLRYDHQSCILGCARWRWGLRPAS